MPDALLPDLFRTMTRIRAFETAVAQHFRAGDIHGFVHVSLGQEAVAAGACAALQADDYITTTHRGHGHCIAKGASPHGMMAELFGRSTGICRGKGGSMHIADPRLGILGANGIVGAGIPLAVGAAFAARVRGSTQIAIAFFGEGAVHCGAFHEGAVLAATWSLPVILLCENNGYAEFTRSDRWGGPPLVERARSYGIAAEQVDGSDPRSVFKTVEGFATAARSGGGPFFLEALTNRVSGHYEGDAQQYRPAGELDALRDQDPLWLAEQQLDPDVVEQAKAMAQLEIDDAVAEALRAPYPDESTATEDIYA